MPLCTALGAEYMNNSGRMIGPDKLAARSKRCVHDALKLALVARGELPGSQDMNERALLRSFEPVRQYSSRQR